jgi:hypothetical protein
VSPYRCKYLYHSQHPAAHVPGPHCLSVKLYGHSPSRSLMHWPGLLPPRTRGAVPKRCAKPEVSNIWEMFLFIYSGSRMQHPHNFIHKFRNCMVCGGPPGYSGSANMQRQGKERLMKRVKGLQRSWRGCGKIPCWGADHWRCPPMWKFWHG